MRTVPKNQFLFRIEIVCEGSYDSRFVVAPSIQAAARAIETLGKSIEEVKIIASQDGVDHKELILCEDPVDLTQPLDEGKAETAG